MTRIKVSVTVWAKTASPDSQVATTTPPKISDSAIGVE
jgi:hypothetical protein